MTLRPVIHVGIPRGASTFLQAQVFPNVPQYRFVREPNVKKLGSAHLDGIDQNVVDAFRGFAHTNIILSEENALFRATIFTGSFTSDPRTTVYNLHKLYGRDCYILIVLRRQDTAIDSMIRYKQRYISDPSMYLVDWPVRISWFGAYKAQGLYGKLLDAYNYYRNLFLLLPTFGKENIRILLYEDLVNDREKFFHQLGLCFGQDLTFLIPKTDQRQNMRSHKYSNLPAGYVPMGHMMRKLNNISGFRLERVLPKRRVGLLPAEAQKIRELFAEENQKLDDLFGLGLSRYGYY